MAWQAVHLVRQHGGITVRGNHDEMALERYEMWKKCGRLDVCLLPHTAESCLPVVVLGTKHSPSPAFLLSFGPLCQMHEVVSTCLPAASQHTACHISHRQVAQDVFSLGKKSM